MLTSVEVSSHSHPLKWEDLSVEIYSKTECVRALNSSSPSLRQTQLNFSPNEIKICKQSKIFDQKELLKSEDHGYHSSSADDNFLKTPSKQEPLASDIVSTQALNQSSNVSTSPRILKQTTLTGSISPLAENAFKKPPTRRKKVSGTSKKSQAKRSHSVDSSNRQGEHTNPYETRKCKSTTVSPKKNVRLADQHLDSIQQNKENKSKSQFQTQLTSYGIRRTARQYAKEIERERENNFLIALKNNIETGMKIIQTEEKGRGIIATRSFHEGEFVVEYAGDLISEKIAKQREIEYKRDPSIGSYMFFFVHLGQKYCVDATKETPRLGRLINHSRLKPNCIVKVIPVDGIPRLALFARKPISPGEELLYDYGDRDKESLQAHPWLKT
ncbi:unnamed protein product [Heterobilharzia americana]|nr:unnamed protein product [Heterobilharzia americana]